MQGEPLPKAHMWPTPALCISGRASASSLVGVILLRIVEGCCWGQVPPENRSSWEGTCPAENLGAGPVCVPLGGPGAQDALAGAASLLPGFHF